MKSHYSRGKSKTREYLSPLLSVAEIHAVYVEKYKTQKQKLPVWSIARMDIQVKIKILMLWAPQFQLGDFFLFEGTVFSQIIEILGELTDKRQHECIFTCDQWMDVIKSARVRKPFQVVAYDNTIFLNCHTHFSKFFMKTIKNTLWISQMQDKHTSDSSVG